jgi:hypothetical protein
MPTAYHAMMQPSAYAASWLRSGHGSTASHHQAQTILRPRPTLPGAEASGAVRVVGGWLAQPLGWIGSLPKKRGDPFLRLPTPPEPSRPETKVPVVVPHSHPYQRSAPTNASASQTRPGATSNQPSAWRPRRRPRSRSRRPSPLPGGCARARGRGGAPWRRSWSAGSARGFPPPTTWCRSTRPPG